MVGYLHLTSRNLSRQIALRLKIKVFCKFFMMREAVFYVLVQILGEIILLFEIIINLNKISKLHSTLVILLLHDALNNNSKKSIKALRSTVI